MFFFNFLPFYFSVIKLIWFYVVDVFCSFIGFFFFFSFFKECPHPDEKQRLDLSKRLGLENKQVKFWFQNRRTQMKVNVKYHVPFSFKNLHSRSELWH